jgi:hypothetical protein
MTTRADFLAVLLRQQLRMDTERRAFAGQVSEIVRRNIAGRETFDMLAYMMISREIESVFDRWYGIAPNDPRARFLTLIVDESRRAKAVPIQRAVEDIKRRLPVPIWRAMQREAT